VRFQQLAIGAQPWIALVAVKLFTKGSTYSRVLGYILALLIGVLPVSATALPTEKVVNTNPISKKKDLLNEHEYVSSPENFSKTMSSNACQFERPIADAKRALDHAKAETIRRGGSWEGDLDRGQYNMRTPFGSLEGTYQVVQDNVLFAIQRKPALVPCALIATIIDQFIKP
jgi:hypothetical protein